LIWWWVGDGKKEKQKSKNIRVVGFGEGNIYYLMAGPFFFITCRLLSYFKSSWSLGLGNECHCPTVVQYYDIFQGSIHLNNFLGFKQSYYGVYRFFKFTQYETARLLLLPAAIFLRRYFIFARPSGQIIHLYVICAILPF